MRHGECICTAVRTNLECMVHGELMLRSLQRDEVWRRIEELKIPKAGGDAQFKVMTHVDDAGNALVVLEDVLVSRGYTFTPRESTQLGQRLIRLAEEAITNKMLRDALMGTGMSEPEANAYVATFQHERARMYRG